jgi:hypothetical protein
VGCYFPATFASPLRRSSAFMTGTPPRLILEIDIGELLPGTVRHDKGRTNILNRPWRREAANRHWLQTKAAPKSVLGANGFALTPDAVFREGNRAVELAVGGSPHLVSPHASQGTKVPARPQKHTA